MAINEVTHYTEKFPPGLKTAAEISEKVLISVDRLTELADARIIPHYRFDGGGPLFRPTEIKEWLANNAMERVEGTSLPIKMVRISFETLDKPADPLPSSLVSISDSIRALPTQLLKLCGIYFLCQKTRVVYVGQSVCVPSRISTHTGIKDFDRAYVLPVPKSQLNEVEGAFIRALKPKLNIASNGILCAPGEVDDGAVFQRYGFKR